MPVIHWGKSRKGAWNPNRPMSSLLEWQVEHLHEAEKRLPRHHHTSIYVNAIKTEGEAAEYIRAVTGAIHKAHAEAEELRLQTARRGPQLVGDIAAVADEQTERKQKRQAKKKGARKPKRST